MQTKKLKKIGMASAVLVILLVASFFVIKVTLTGHITGDAISENIADQKQDDSQVNQEIHDAAEDNELTTVSFENVGCKYDNPGCGSGYTCLVSQNKCVRSSGGGGGGSSFPIIDIGGY